MFLAEIIDPNILASRYGFNYDENSLIITVHGKVMYVHIGYDQATNTQLVIAHTRNRPHLYYFTVLRGMNEEEATGSRHAELVKCIEDAITPRNRIAARAIPLMLEEAVRE